MLPLQGIVSKDRQLYIKAMSTFILSYGNVEDINRKYESQ